MAPLADSPPLRGFLRALIFVGLTEAIFFRLLPEPSVTASGGTIERLHRSVSSAGATTFLLAFVLVTLALLAIAWRTLKDHPWPSGLNGFLAVCFLCLALLGATAGIVPSGPAFAIAFTLLSLLTLLFVAMHAFATSDSVWERSFLVLYSASVLAGALGTVPRFAARIAPGSEALMAAAQRALDAGTALSAVAAALAFMAYVDTPLRGAGAGRSWAGLLLGALGAGALAAGSLMAPESLSLLGGSSSPVEVLLLSMALFLGSMTAVTNLLEPRRRTIGYGLLLLVLAGYPMRIAHQDMLMIVGAFLLLCPDPARRTAPVRQVGFVDLPARW